MEQLKLRLNIALWNFKIRLFQLRLRHFDSWRHHNGFAVLLCFS
jgi:hypothetical protein